MRLRPLVRFVDDHAAVHAEEDPTGRVRSATCSAGLTRQGEDGDVDAGRLAAAGRQVDRSRPVALDGTRREADLPGVRRVTVQLAKEIPRIDQAISSFMLVIPRKGLQRP